MDHDEATDVIRAVTAAFDRHDLEGIMAHFADDAVFEGPRGREPYGQRFVGRDVIRAAFAGRFEGIPDIRYRDDAHFVDGDRGTSEWTLSGTTTTGQRIEVRGCDLWTFRHLVAAPARSDAPPMSPNPRTGDAGDVVEIAPDVYLLGPTGSTQTDVYFARSESSWVLIDAGWAKDGPAIAKAAAAVFRSFARLR